MKEPGQIAYEAYIESLGSSATWQMIALNSVRQAWAAAELASIDSAFVDEPKPKAAGVWLEDHRWLALSHVVQVYNNGNGDWGVETSTMTGLDEEVCLSESDARKIIEALGGEWLEASDEKG